MKSNVKANLAVRLLPSCKWVQNPCTGDVYADDIGIFFSPETNAAHRELVQLWLEDRYWDFGRYADGFRANNSETFKYVVADTHLERLEKAVEIELEIER